MIATSGRRSSSPTATPLHLETVGSGDVRSPTSLTLFAGARQDQRVAGGCSLGNHLSEQGMNDEEDEEQSNAGASTPEPVHLGPPQDPHVGGEMTLFEAAYWIASEGGAASFDTDDASIWRRAAEALHARIVDGSVILMGRRHGVGFAEHVDGVLLSGVEMNPPYSTPAPLSLIMGRQPYIDYSVRVSREQWQDSEHDDLHGANRVPEYTHLQVRAPDIAKIWPFTKAQANTEEQDQSYRTGSPGRPTKGRGLIVEEFNRRCSAGEWEPVLAEEARALRRWFEKEHPRMDPMATGTIQNVIRDQHNKLRLAKKKPT